MKDFKDKINLPVNDYIYHILSETVQQYQDEIDRDRVVFSENEQEIMKLKSCRSVFKDRKEVLKFIDLKIKTCMDVMIKLSDKMDEDSKKLETIHKAKRELGV